MLRSRAEGDEDAFFSIALQVAAAEARQGRRQTAQEMRAEIDKARARNSRGASVAIPFASPRGSLEGLLEIREARYKLKDVVLNDRLLARFEDILRQQRKRDWLREHGKVPNRLILFVGPSWFRQDHVGRGGGWRAAFADFNYTVRRTNYPLHG
jgi:hypothetical protein